MVAPQQRRLPGQHPHNQRLRPLPRNKAVRRLRDWYSRHERHFPHAAYRGAGHSKRTGNGRYREQSESLAPGEQSRTALEWLTFTTRISLCADRLLQRGAGLETWEWHSHLSQRLGTESRCRAYAVAGSRLGAFLHCPWASTIAHSHCRRLILAPTGDRTNGCCTSSRRETPSWTGYQVANGHPSVWLVISILPDMTYVRKDQTTLLEPHVTAVAGSMLPTNALRVLHLGIAETSDPLPKVMTKSRVRRLEAATRTTVSLNARCSDGYATHDAIDTTDCGDCTRNTISVRETSSALWRNHGKDTEDSVAGRTTTEEMPCRVGFQEGKKAAAHLERHPTSSKSVQDQAGRTFPPSTIGIDSAKCSYGLRLVHATFLPFIPNLRRSLLMHHINTNPPVGIDCAEPLLSSTLWTILLGARY